MGLPEELYAEHSDEEDEEPQKKHRRQDGRNGCHQRIDHGAQPPRAPHEADRPEDFEEAKRAQDAHAR